MKRLLLVAALALCGTQTLARPVACVLEPRLTTTLSSSVDGVITEVHVGRGDRVEKGDTLIQLDDQLEWLQVKLSEARAISDVNMRAQEARRSLREKEFARAEELSSRNIAAETVLEDAEIELALTVLSLEEAQLNQILVQIELEQARALWERRRILSPVSGIVVNVDVNPGEFANEQLELLTIADTDALHVEVFTPGEYFGRLHKGDVFPVRLLPPLERVFEAQVDTVDEIFDAASGTFGVRLVVDNAAGQIPAGARCEVDFQGQGF